MEQDLAAVARILARSGALRAAINTGNPVLAKKGLAGGDPGGVSVELAREMGRRLDCPVKLVPYEAAGRVFDALDRDEWDIAFLAIEPERAAKVDFSAPYVVIEGTYMVRKDAPFTTVADVDRAGIRIAVGRNAAYDLFLTRTLRHAEIVRAPSPAESLTLFEESGLEVVAGVRQMLVTFAAGRDDLRVMPDRFTAIHQAIGTPRRHAEASGFVRGFVEDVKASSFVRAALDRNGHADVTVAPPSEPKT